MPDTTFLDIRGRKTQLTIGGAGPALLYLHSAGGETEWTRFHELLSQSFTLYVPAHPGFALSTGLDTVRDIYDYAWHYVDLIEELNLRGVPIVGFSLGAWIAMELAILRPELVSRLILTSAAGVRVEGHPFGELFVDDFDRIRRLVFFDPDSPAVAEAMPLSTNDSRILLWLRAREATARVGWNPYLHNPRLPAHLHRITHLSKILWGREDRLLPLACGEYLAQHLPNAQLEVFEQCGHMLPFEKPNEFVAAIKNFLT